MCNMKELAFNNGKFKIIQFTDLHCQTNGETICYDDKETLKLMHYIIEAENPDLIVLTGDAVYGENNVLALETALIPIVEANLPWAYVFGNHDSEYGSDKTILFKAAQAIPNCLMQNFDNNISGLGNYYLELKSITGDVKWVLYFMDSLQYNNNKNVEGYDFFKRDQINWYFNTSSQLHKLHPNHSQLAFFHIPLPEYNDVWNHSICYGNKLENVCCPKQNSGMFSSMLEVGVMKGIFAGHDHINDYHGNLHGIELFYGRGSGHNTYSTKGYIHGARVIELCEEDSIIKSWLRLENHTVILEQQEHIPQFERKNL